MKSKAIKIKLNNVEDIKQLVRTTSRYKSDIDVISGRNVIDAKSFLGLIALDLTQDISIKIISDDVIECRKFEYEMEDFRL